MSAYSMIAPEVIERRRVKDVEIEGRRIELVDIYETGVTLLVFVDGDEVGSINVHHYPTATLYRPFSSKLKGGQRKPSNDLNRLLLRFVKIAQV